MKNQLTVIESAQLNEIREMAVDGDVQDAISEVEFLMEDLDEDSDYYEKAEDLLMEFKGSEEFSEEAMKNQTELRPFTDSDWDCFSGCESDNPRIAEGTSWHLIVDGQDVEFTHDDSAAQWVVTFPDCRTALRVAYAIIASPTRSVVAALLEHWEESPDSYDGWQIG